jgi:hypothetical protein
LLWQKNKRREEEYEKIDDDHHMRVPVAWSALRVRYKAGGGRDRLDTARRAGRLALELKANLAS